MFKLPLLEGIGHDPRNHRSRSSGIPTHKLNGSQIAAQALALIAKLYKVERDARELEPPARLVLRQSRAKPIADALHAWLLAQRRTLAKADITAKAIDDSLSSWRALTRYLDDGNVPIDNNGVENSIRPLAVGRNWLFGAATCARRWYSCGDSWPRPRPRPPAPVIGQQPRA